MAGQKNIEKKNTVRKLFSGDVLLSDTITKQRWYLVFLFFLALFYIGFHYNMAQTVKQVRKLEREVTTLQAEYATRSSELMRMSKQSEIIKMLKEKNGINVAAPKAPPKRIRD